VVNSNYDVVSSVSKGFEDEQKCTVISRLCCKCRPKSTAPQFKLTIAKLQLPLPKDHPRKPLLE
jgi:hypothetical protein